MDYLQPNTVHNIDCLEGLKLLEPNSVDLFCIDPPYGQTHNKWDSIIDPDKLWELLMRALKPNGVIVMFGKGAFMARMIMSNEKHYRYSWVWEKTSPGGFLNANKMPLSAHEDIMVFSPDDAHEDIMVFYKHLPKYNPQKTTGHKRKVATANHKRNSSHGTNYGEYGNTTYDSTERYPTTVLRFPSDKQRERYHPTQKPIDLIRFIVRTYTDKGDLLVDCCCGSGSALIAAQYEGRNFIGMDNGVCEDEKSPYFNIPWADVSKMRIDKHREFSTALDSIPEPKDFKL